MNKPSFLTEFFGRRSLSVVLALILLPIITVSQVAPSQENEGVDRQEAIRRIVQTYIQTGQEEYQKGFYEQALKTFLMAQGYEEYLTVATREQLMELLKESQIAVLERKSALETFRVVNDLIKRDQLIAAKTYLEKIKDSKYLTTEEKKQIAEVFRQIDAQLIAAKAKQRKEPAVKEKPVEAAAEVKKPVLSLDERKKEVAELWNRSVELYYTGQYEEARKGFVQVAASDLIPPQMQKAVEGYLYQIDKLLPQIAEQKLVQEQEEPVVVAVVEPGVGEPVLAEPKVVSEEVTQEVAPRVASPVTGESNYIEVINRKRNIIRSHTRAVVNDAIAKAHDYISQARFDKAKNVVETAALTVNQNQMHLGDELFKEYSSKLKVLTEEIADAENKNIRQQEQEKRQAAAEAQSRFRTQMEIDREKQIAELMENALTYQKQQRYEAACGQLVSLLALDPQNERALVLKDTLEDMIYFRKQLDVQKESHKQRADVLMKTEESGIPYAEELTYPKYWRELVEKPTRQPDKPIGLDPLDAAVYEQLEQIVDLSDLTPGMSFGEVIERLRNSVQPPVQIQPNWKDLLENAEVEQSTPAGMDPLTGVKLRRALEILLAGVSSIDFAQVIYVVDEGVIQVGTEDMLERKMVNRVYDISDLVAEPANFRGMGGMGGMMGGMGGGMMGGMGGGMGGYGGGMGGMGGGMGGYGGGMGGGMGGYGGGMMGGSLGSQSLVQLIQESINPESWFDLSDTGEGTITPYPTQQPKKLAVYNTHEVHVEIEKLLAALRKSLGHQVSIEARFLVVSENFLEDVGLDVDFLNNLGGKWGSISFEQNSAIISETSTTQVPLSFGNIGMSAASITGGYGSILDDLQVSFLIRATQAHRDSKSMTAPIATVLSGESATFNINRSVTFPLPPVQTQGVTQVSGAAGTTSTGGSNEPQYITVPIGSILTITPVITHDKKNVLLNIITIQNEFLGLNKSEVQAPIIGGGAGQVQTWEVSLPETERSSLMTRVSVPDTGTLLLGGQRITVEVDKESGVPILSKIPVIGRLFGNRSKVKDHKILLILVKPTIILQEEREAEAIAALESE